MTTPDHDRDHDDRSRDDWWTAFTAWLRADPARSGPQHEHRARLGRGPDAQVHRGPDGTLYYGCCVPPGAVPVDQIDREPIDEGRWPPDRAADHPVAAHQADDVADDDGDGS